MKLFKKNKPLAIALLVLLVLIVLGIIFLIVGLTGNGTSAYGNRLDGIEDVQIKDKTTNSILKDFEDKDGVEKASYRLQGRILKFTITSKDLSIEDAKKLVDLVKLSKKQLKYYDIQILFESDDKGYPLIAYKNKKSDNYSFTYNKVGETDE